MFTGAKCLFKSPWKWGPWLWCETDRHGGGGVISSFTDIPPPHSEPLFLLACGASPPVLLPQLYKTPCVCINPRCTNPPHAHLNILLDNGFQVCAFWQWLIVSPVLKFYAFSWNHPEKMPCFPTHFVAMTVKLPRSWTWSDSITAHLGLTQDYTVSPAYWHSFVSTFPPA